MGHKSVYRKLSFILGITLLMIIHGGGSPAIEVPCEPEVPLFNKDVNLDATSINRIKEMGSEIQLINPFHTVNFTEDGIGFMPNSGAPLWSWSNTSLEPVIPSYENDRIVYQYDNLIEQYILKEESLEQQFIINDPPENVDEQFIITGTIQSNGSFGAINNSWAWGNEHGQVILGDVYVFDAVGDEVPAHMEVDASSTRIIVELSGVEENHYPVTIDPEIYSNDFRISFTGPDGETAYSGKDASISYNESSGNYLVVWAASLNGEQEIYGQLIDGLDGSFIGSQFQISLTNPSGVARDASSPDVASLGSNFCVVWHADDNGDYGSGPLPDNKNEVYAQIVNASTGALVLGTQVRISYTGLDTNASVDGTNPAIAANPTSNMYYIVWYSDHESDGQFEVFGQELAANGTLTVSNSRLSQMGTTPNALYDAFRPDIAWNSTQNQYMVAWHGDNQFIGDGENEIFIRRVDGAVASHGSLMGSDILVSDMGTAGDPNLDAKEAAISYNSTDDNYLIVWDGDDDTGILVNDENEIFGQFASFNGTVANVNAFFRISNMGPDGDINYDAVNPALSYDPFLEQFLVTWHGDDDAGALVDGENEIFGQLLQKNGTKIGSSIRLSDAGGLGSTAYTATFPASEYNSESREHLIAWHGDDNWTTTIDNEIEVWGQRFAEKETEPTAQPTTFSTSSITQSSFTVSYGAAAGAPEGYIALRKSGSSPTDLPVDQQAYSIGDPIGTSTVAYVGSSLTFNETGLSPNTTYYYDIFSYNGQNSSLNYRTASPLQGNETTLFAEPSTQATSIVFSSTGTDEITVNFTNGNGSSRLLVGRQGTISNFPQDATSYTANSVFGSGTNLGSSTYVLGSGSGPFTITNLLPGTEYHFRVFEYNGSGSLINYDLSTATGNPASAFTLSLQPSNQPTALSLTGITVNSMNGSFAAAGGSPDGYLVLRKAGSAPTSNPQDGTAYTAGNSIGDGTVVSSGSSTTFASTSLSPDTDYFYEIFSYNGSGTSINYLTTSPLAGNATTLATEPTGQATSLVFSDVTDVSLTGSYTSASGSPAGYIVLQKSGSSPTDVPADGATYVAGNTIGTSTVAYSGALLTFDDSGLTANTTYYYDIFSYNGSNASTNYLTTSPLEGNRTTLTSEPATQATSIVFSSLQPTEITLNFTDGNGVSRLVVAQVGSAVDVFPVDGNSYTANNVFGSGTDLGSSNFVVAQGTGPFTITDLSIATEYHFHVFEFNGSGGLENYNTSSATGNPSSVSTLSIAPTNQPTNISFSSITDVSMDVGFSAAADNPTGYLAVRKEGGYSIGAPLDGTTYSAGDPLGDGTVAYVGSSTSFGDTGLSPESGYFYRIFSYNGSGATVIFLTTSPLEGNSTTLDTEPVSQPTLLSFDAITSTSMTASFTAASGTPEGYIVLRKSGSSPTEMPLDGTTYSDGEAIGTSTVVNVGNTITFDESGLQSNTTYHYDVIAYNGAGVATNYLISTPLEGSSTTLAAEPATQATEIVFSGLGPNEITVSFSNGDGESRLVVGKEGSVVNSLPQDAATYIADASFGSGSDLGASNFVVGMGSGPFTITGLAGATEYHFQVFEFNGSGGLENYNTSSSTNNPSFISTLAPEPLNQPTALVFSDITANSLVGSFTVASDSPSGYLVLQKEGSVGGDLPADGIVYAINDIIGSSTVVYSGSDNTFAGTGLNAGTIYHYAVFSSNGSGATINYLDVNPVASSVITISPAPEVLDPTQVATTSFTTAWNASQGAEKYELDVSTDNFITFVTGYEAREVTSGLEEAVTDLSSNTAYKYRVRAVNASGVSANSLDKSVTTLEEVVPNPLEMSNPVVQSNASGYTVSVTLSGGSGTRAVDFGSRGIIAQNFNEIPLTSATDTYETTVLDADLDDLGLEFYFTATDELTTTPLTSSGFIYREIVLDQTSIQGLSSGGTVENFRIISIPYDLEDNLVQSIFGTLGEYNISEWRLIRYQNGKNVDFPAFNRILPGNGYWFNSVNPVEIKLAEGTVPKYNQQNDFELTLTAGWNQIGNPYPFNIDWSDVQAANPGLTVGALKVFQPSSVGFTETDNLQVWSGGFVFADNAGSISFPVTLKTSAGSRKSGNNPNVIVSGELDGEEWFVPLRLSHGDGENQMIGFGMHPEAVESKDRFDDITVPRFFNYLEMKTEHPEFFAPNFGRDVVATDDQYRWTFEVQSNFEGEIATLQWDPDLFGENQCMLLLYDDSNQRMVDMKQVGSYEFELNGVKQLEFIYSLEEGAWQSDITVLGLPFPNPATETINIPLLLRDQEPIRLEILDMMGRSVKVLYEGSLEGGTQTISWNRENEANERVNPGVYLVDLVSGNIRQVKKIIIK